MVQRFELPTGTGSTTVAREATATNTSVGFNMNVNMGVKVDSVPYFGHPNQMVSQQAVGASTVTVNAPLGPGAALRSTATQVCHSLRGSSIVVVYEIINAEIV